MTAAAIASRDAAAPAESATKGWLRALKMAAQVEASPGRTLGDLVAEQADRLGDAPALISDGETMSYGELAARANRWSRWALRQGLAKGETVALILGPRPEYLAIWLGITRVGGVVALINPGLRGASLAHALSVAAPRHILIGEDLYGDRADTLAALADDGAALHVGPWNDSPFQPLDSAPLSAAERRGVTQADLALLIYTSGTTGMPKAAKISHHRVMTWAHWFAGVMDARADDRLYDCLPMHHSVGGVVAPGALLVAGGSVVIAERFSASGFWSDIIRFECTVFQYIGELCRYLLQTPPGADDRAHRLRLALGNGLGGDIWKAFQARFAIPRILEFYAATEGAFSLYNLEGETGALGRIPPFLAHRFPLALVEFDPETEEPTRDPTGRCRRCIRGEAGEAIARIARRPGEAGGRFDGYTSAADTARKILRDVFEPGDAWARSGDLMRQDDRGFFRFVDRVGDTFRWKGENVATTEVAEALNAFPGIEDACVYGVGVPGADGRAGMAALVVDSRFDIQGLAGHLAARLPPYALPLYVRLVARLSTTETFKQQKTALAAEGFDAANITDPLFRLDSRRAAYVAFPGGASACPSSAPI